MIFFHTPRVKTEAEMHCSGKGKYTNEGKVKTFILLIQGQTLECNHLIKINHLKITEFTMQSGNCYQGIKTVKLCEHEKGKTCFV